MEKPIKLATLTKEITKSRMDELLQLEQFWIDEPWTKSSFLYELPSKWKLSSYAELNNELVGYTIASKPQSDTCYWHKLLVNPNHRNLGLGSKLHEYLVQTCKRNNIPKIEMKSLIDNLAVHKVFAKYGAKIIGQETGPDGKQRYLHRELL